MAFDMDNLAPAPDVDSFDPKGMDRGDDIGAKEVPVVDDKQVEDDVKTVTEDLGKKDEEVEDVEDEEVEGVEEEGEEKGELARDEKGRFKSEPRIPKSRFDEQVGKEREAREAAERRAAELERQLNQRQQQITQTEQIEALESNIEKMEAKHAELLLDGNTTEAAKVMKEIRLAERQIATAEADARAAARTAQTLEADRMELAIANLEANYPALNPESAEFDSDLVELVLAKQRTLMSTEGFTPSKALTKAAESVAKRFLQPPAEEVKGEKGLASAKLVEDRKAAQVKKNLETQKSQPASMEDAGIDSDKLGEKRVPDVSLMTAEEFDALPASTKARMRGDFV